MCAFNFLWITFLVFCITGESENLVGEIGINFTKMMHPTDKVGRCFKNSFVMENFKQKNK